MRVGAAAAACAQRWRERRVKLEPACRRCVAVVVVVGELGQSHHANDVGDKFLERPRFARHATRNNANDALFRDEKKFKYISFKKNIIIVKIQTKHLSAMQSTQRKFDAHIGGRVDDTKRKSYGLMVNMLLFYL